eukprot:TRINITY_DN3306_c0_g1_i1.p2 TRINITY_DN3306_c0_g1~~TRINITY_DN3306_c0_g1_i1.p2  ORF type:complete len:397 (-),score=104.04 TRINITY_DN3306_c0_g1_i1:859-2049(-)
MFLTSRRLQLCMILFFICLLILERETLLKPSISSSSTELNNYGPHRHLAVSRDRQKGTEEKDLKVILAWNEAYGGKVYDIGSGREAFYKYKCPETRCMLTDDRGLRDVEDFDAILFHQRSFKWEDIPTKRSPHQRYIHWVIESAQYVYMDIASLNGFFNWTMTYRRDSDFYLPYGRFVKIKEHPTDPKELQKLITKFGKENSELARGRKKNQAAWFVSHCATMARREVYARYISKHYPLHIYGKCGKYKCDRQNENYCYEMLEENYKYYLSFENSICNDYVTEKFFSALKLNIIPIALTGADLKTLAPPHSHINVFDFNSPKKLTELLKDLDEDDEKYAEYFWWKNYYEIRDQVEDRAQSYCDLCASLWSSSPPKVYDSLNNWWIRESDCKRITIH